MLDFSPKKEIIKVETKIESEGKLMERREEWCGRCSWLLCRHNKKGELTSKTEDFLLNQTAIDILQNKKILTENFWKFHKTAQKKFKHTHLDATMLLKMRNIGAEKIKVICKKEGISFTLSNFNSIANSMLRICVPTHPLYAETVRIIQQTENCQPCFELVA